MKGKSRERGKAQWVEKENDKERKMGGTGERENSYEIPAAETSKSARSCHIVRVLVGHVRRHQNRTSRPPQCSSSTSISSILVVVVVVVVVVV